MTLNSASGFGLVLMGLWGTFLVGAGLARAQDEDAPSGTGTEHGAEPQILPSPRCEPSCSASRPAPKIVLHMQKPVVEVVDDTDQGCRLKNCRLFACHHKAPKTAAQQVYMASVVQPLALGFGANYTLHSATHSLDNYDYAHLRALQDLELQTAHVAGLQAMRDAEAKMFTAHANQLRAHINAITQGLSQKTSDYGGATSQSVDGDTKRSIMDRLEQMDRKLNEINDLKARVTNIENKLKDAGTALQK